MLQNVHDLLVTLPTPTLMIFIGVTNSYSSSPQPTSLDRSSDQPATILTEFFGCQFAKTPALGMPSWTTYHSFQLLKLQRWSWLIQWKIQTSRTRSPTPSLCFSYPGYGAPDGRQPQNPIDSEQMYIISGKPLQEILPKYKLRITQKLLEIVLGISVLGNIYFWCRIT